VTASATSSHASGLCELPHLGQTIGGDKKPWPCRSFTPDNTGLAIMPGNVFRLPWLYDNPRPAADPRLRRVSSSAYLCELSGAAAAEAICVDHKP